MPEHVQKWNDGDATPQLHICEFLRVFSAQVRRPHYVALAGTKRGLAKLATRIDNLELDMRFAVKLPLGKRQELIETLSDILSKKGAGKSCVIWIDSFPQGLVAPLHTVLSEYAGLPIALMISCIPGKLAYYQGEGRNLHYVFVSDN